MQDGMLAYYLEQAKFSDANVQARIEREPFNFQSFLDEAAPKKHQAVDAAGHHNVNRDS